MVAIVCSMSVNAQVIKVCKGSEVVATYTPDQADNVIFAESPKVASITLNRTSATIYKGSTITLTATVLPENAADKSISWTSSNEAVASVSSAGIVTAIAVGSASISAAAKDGSGINATCAVAVSDDPSDSHEYVNLGLPSGTLWATKNVGATNIYDYGDYFAWGDTFGYNSENGFSTYKYYKETKPDTIIEKDNQGFEIKTIVCHRGYTKYVNSSDSSSYGYDGFYDDKTTLESSDDAATANWGNKWKMPSIPQWRELRLECTWTWCTLNGVSGNKITGPNGNYIFLPAAGYLYCSSLIETGTASYYWSNMLETFESDFAEDMYGYGIYRSNCLSVRAVRSE